MALTTDKDEAVVAALRLMNEADRQRIRVPPDWGDKEELLAGRRQRCDCENHVKALKQAFSLNGLSSADFFVNPLCFRMQTLGYRLLSALKLIESPANWRTLTLKPLIP